jgi:hypothetical protein
MGKTKKIILLFVLVCAVCGVTVAQGQQKIRQFADSKGQYAFRENVNSDNIFLSAIEGRLEGKEVDLRAYELSPGIKLGGVMIQGNVITTVLLEGAEVKLVAAEKLSPSEKKEITNLLQVWYPGIRE